MTTFHLSKRVAFHDFLQLCFDWAVSVRETVSADIHEQAYLLNGGFALGVEVRVGFKLAYLLLQFEGLLRLGEANLVFDAEGTLF